jgi:DNA-binding transcriptional regulator PaaX
MVLRTQASDVLLGLADGVFGTTVDMTLWLVAYFGTMSLPQSSSGQLWRAQIEADRFLSDVNYEVIKHALQNAKRQGWIKKTRRHAWPEITEAGKKRLNVSLPIYDEKRVWDGKVHLVTYDIPEKKHNDRSRLRERLKRLGCGMLQESVWLTPYNPIDALRSFINERRLEGTVIVSDLGKDGSVGDEDLSSLIIRVYHLDTLNGRYESLLKEIRGNPVGHWEIMHYFAILHDDPQLPFALLPVPWAGEMVYKLLKPNLKSG